MSRKLTLLCVITAALAVPGAAHAAVQTATGQQSVTATTSDALAITLASTANLGAITPGTTSYTSTGGAVTIATLDHWALQVQAVNGDGALHAAQECDDIADDTSVGGTFGIAAPAGLVGNALAGFTGVQVTGAGEAVSGTAPVTYATGQGPAAALPLNYTLSNPDISKIRANCSYDAPMQLTLSGSGVLQELLDDLGL